MNAPTIEQRRALSADHARRYAAIQASADRTVRELDAALGRRGPEHTDALREVMRAGERAAHLSRGYTPEPEADDLAETSLPHMLAWSVVGLAVMWLIGWACAPAVAKALVWLGVL